MRILLADQLVAAGSQLSWDHLRHQRGIFSFSGLTPAQVERLAKEYHIYLVSNGRLSVAGITHTNVEYVAKAIHSVTKRPSSRS